jgi:hypothetical protein
MPVHNFINRKVQQSPGVKAENRIGPYEPDHDADVAAFRHLFFSGALSATARIYAGSSLCTI